MTNQTTATKIKPPFRCDVVGSYLRPTSLKEARQKYTQNKISADALTEIEDQAITELIKKQKDAGLKVITDGEFRRSWWHLDFMWGLNGVEKNAVEKGYVFNGKSTRAETARLTGKINGASHPFVEHFAFVQQFAEEGIVPRQTIPAPAQFLAELQRPENAASTEKYYPNEAELLADIAAAYQTVIKDLYQAGCRSLQLDDCTWGMLVDPGFSAGIAAENVKKEEKSCSCGAHHELPRNAAVDQLAKQYVALNNEAIKDLPEDLVVATHVCRGNYQSKWASSGGYESIADVLFAKENAAAYYLEFDTERSGDFTPLRHVSEGKSVVLGLVSSKIGDLENKDDVIGRIKEAAEYVPLDHLFLSTQCGFASTEEGNRLTEEQQWAKIAFVKEVAEAVWGS